MTDLEFPSPADILTVGSLPEGERASALARMLLAINPQPYLFEDFSKLVRAAIRATFPVGKRRQAWPNVRREMERGIFKEDRVSAMLERILKKFDEETES